MYTLTEWDGTPIEGAFYVEELMLVKGEIFKVEKIVRYGTRQGCAECSGKVGRLLL